jgi:hypothetical protein
MRAAAVSGVCGPKLFLIIWTWAVMLWADVAECESLNNLLKLQTNRAPRISLELVDARCKLKKHLGVSAQKLVKDTHAAGKFRTRFMAHDALLERAAAVVTETVDFGAEAEKIIHNLERWSAPSVPKGLPSPEEVKEAMKRLSKSTRPHHVNVWGAAYALLFWRGQEEGVCVLECGFAFGSQPDVLWCCVQRYEKSLGVVVRMELRSGRLHVPIPITCSTVLDLFCSKYEEANALQHLRLYKVPLLWPAHHGLPAAIPKVGSSTAETPLAFESELVFQMTAWAPPKTKLTSTSASTASSSTSPAITLPSGSASAGASASASTVPAPRPAPPSPVPIFELTERCVVSPLPCASELS